MVHDEPDSITDSHTDHSAHKSDKSGFQQEHIADGSQIASQYLDDADLFGTFIDGHHHRIGDTNGCYKQGDGSDAAQHQLDHIVCLLGLLDPFHLAVGLESHIRNGFLDCGNIFHIIHIHICLIINKIGIWFSFFVGWLTRDRILLINLL